MVYHNSVTCTMSEDHPTVVLDTNHLLEVSVMFLFHTTRVQIHTVIIINFIVFEFVRNT